MKTSISLAESLDLILSGRVYLPNTVSIFREDYKHRRTYLADLQELRKAYDYRVRVQGGWKFFTFVSDYKTWKAQK